MIEQLTHEYAIVEWIDSRIITTGWESMSGLKSYPVSTCVSSGVVIKQDDNQLTLAHSVGVDADSGSFTAVCGRIIIPKISIKKLRIFNIHQLNLF